MTRWEYFRCRWLGWHRRTRLIISSQEHGEYRVCRDCGLGRWR